MSKCVYCNVELTTDVCGEYCDNPDCVLNNDDDDDDSDLDSYPEADEYYPSDSDEFDGYKD